jgi:hypothetical protein
MADQPEKRLGQRWRSEKASSRPSFGPQRVELHGASGFELVIPSLSCFTDAADQQAYLERQT